MESTSNKILLSWTAPEFIRYEKTRTWFISLAVLTAGIFIISIIIKNYFFALLVLISSFLVFIHAQKHPRQITIAITDEKITFGDIVSLPHKDISSFWIFEKPEIKILSLETKKILRPKISILLSNQDPAAVKKVLTGLIKEKKHEESLADIIAKKLKF